jgi:hypothetical protein
MFTNLNLQAPDFLIKCNALTYSNEVYIAMRSNYIERSYVYAIAIDDPTQKFQYQIIKIGRSSPNPGDNEVDVGERIARQLAHLNGWQYYTGMDPISSHGQDFLNVVQRAINQKLLPANFNKDMITVGVWDITARMPQVLQTAVTNEFLATGYAEAELVKQYKNTYGNLPICNIQDPSNYKVYKGYIPKSVGQMFGWV